MLDAIANSNGSRLSVVRNVFKTNVKGGIMGTFRFDKKGEHLPFKMISFDRWSAPRASSSPTSA